MLLLFACSLSFTACSDDEPAEGAGSRMALSENAVMFIQGASSKEVAVTNGGEWTVTVPQEAASWCSAERNGESLIVTVTENTASELTREVVERYKIQQSVVVVQTGMRLIVIRRIVFHNKRQYPLLAEIESVEVELNINQRGVLTRRNAGNGVEEEA